MKPFLPEEVSDNSLNKAYLRNINIITSKRSFQYLQVFEHSPEFVIFCVCPLDVIHRKYRFSYCNTSQKYFIPVSHDKEPVVRYKRERVHGGKSGEEILFEKQHKFSVWLCYTQVSKKNLALAF